MTARRKERRQGKRVVCTACGHRWIGFYLPLPISDAIKLMGTLMCPKCAADADKILVTGKAKAK
jgi:hypothetical protein